MKGLVVMVRSLMVVLVVVAVITSGCSSGDSDEVAALEGRIAELEAAASSTVPSTLPPSTITTVAESTTTTVLAPTTTLASFDVESINSATLTRWSDGNFPPKFVAFIRGSCEGAATALSAIASAIVIGASEPMDALALADDGNGSVSDAVSAFDEYKSAVTVALAVVKVIANNPDMGPAAQYASGFDAEYQGLLFSVVAINTFVLDPLANELDEESGVLWAPIFVDGILAVQNLISPLVSQQC